MEEIWKIYNFRWSQIASMKDGQKKLEEMFIYQQPGELYLETDFF